VALREFLRPTTNYVPPDFATSQHQCRNATVNAAAAASNTKQHQCANCASPVAFDGVNCKGLVYSVCSLEYVLVEWLTWQLTWQCPHHQNLQVLDFAPSQQLVASAPLLLLSAFSYSKCGYVTYDSNTSHWIECQQQQSARMLLPMQSYYRNVQRACASSGDCRYC
jgi:hypothetical protein